MGLFNLMNKTRNILNEGLVIAASLLALSVILGELAFVIKGEMLTSAFNSFSDLLSLLCPYVIVYFAVLRGSRGNESKKALYAVFCTALLLTAFSLRTVEKPSLLIAVFLSFVAIYFYKSFSFVTASSLLTVFSLLSGILMGVLSEYATDTVTDFSSVISGKSAFASVIFSLFKTFFDFLDYKTFENLFYFKSSGGSQLIDGRIVTGISDLFSEGYRGKLLSVYVTGNYIKGFALAGLSAALCTLLRGEKRASVIILGLASLISGNAFFIILYALLCSLRFAPVILILYALSYGVSDILDLRTGFTVSGGIAELFAYLNKPLYFILVCAVIIAFSFFISRYTALKYGISAMSEVYIPNSLKQFCNALGGVGNIVSIEENKVTLRNIKRADFLKLTCEIADNAVILDSTEELSRLEEYLE